VNVVKMKWAWFGLSLATLACSKENAAPLAYGDPIGIRLEGDSKGPSLAVAVAATQGKDLTPGVNALAGAFLAASKACPDLTPVATSGALRLKMKLVKGKFVAPAQLPAEPVAACVSKALDGKAILPDTSESMDILAEFHMELPGAR
jgi:hypothetical protein